MKEGFEGTNIVSFEKKKDFEDKLEEATGSRMEFVSAVQYIQEFLENHKGDVLDVDAPEELEKFKEAALVLQTGLLLKKQIDPSFDLKNEGKLLYACETLIPEKPQRSEQAEDIEAA